MRRSTLRNLAWAVVFGGLVFLGPFRPSDLLGGLLMAALVAGFVFVYRSRRRDEGAPVQTIDRDARFGDLMRDGLAGVAAVSSLLWLCFAVSLYLFVPVFVWFYGQWTSSVWDNGHGLFVPLGIALLSYRQLRTEVDTAPESSAWGFVFLGVGMLAVALDAVLHTRYLAAMGLVVSLPGYSLVLLGIRRTRKLWLPLALAIFLIPVPQGFSDQILMREWTAKGSEWVMELLGVPVFQNFTVLVLPQYTVDVSQACSGFAALYAGAFAGIVLAAFARPAWRKVLVLAGVVPLALVANVVRVLLLVFMVHYFGREVAESDVHPGLGAISFVIVLGGLVLLAGRRAVRTMFQ